MTGLLKRHSLPVLSGLLLACAFPRFHLYPIAWMALVPVLFAAARAPNAWQSAIRFYVAGWVFYSILLQWLMANIMWAGGWAFLGYQILCLGMALFWALLGALWWTLHKRGPRFAGALALAALWVAMEWLQANALTGFGWGALGYTQAANLPLAQCAAIGGVGLLSFLVVLVNALAALGLAESSRRWRRWATAACVVAAAHGAGALLLNEAAYEDEAFTVGVVQTDFPQELKWDSEYAQEMLLRTIAYSERLAKFEDVDLFVWPEALLVDHYDRRSLRDPLQEFIQRTGIPVFTGSVREDYTQNKRYNSSVLFDQEGVVLDHYDKVHLAPFGEYQPFSEYVPFLRLLGFGNSDAGDVQRVLEISGHRFGPLICFETLFCGMAETLRKEGAEFLVVITNLAWFGGSNAIPQELEIARMRAIETRLPLVHCANTGISGVFDPYGRFSPVNARLAHSGHYAKAEDYRIPLASLIMRRWMGALPLAQAAKRPIPHGPALFPWAAMALAVLLALLVLAIPGEAAPPPPEDPEPESQEPPPPDSPFVEAPDDHEI